MQPVRGQKLIHKGHLLQDETVLRSLLQKVGCYDTVIVVIYI